MSEDLEFAVSVFPDGATSWIADINIPAWDLHVDMYAFTAEGENEAVFAMHRFVKQNFEMLRALGPDRLSLLIPSQPKFEATR